MNGLNRLGLGTILIAILIVLLGMVDFGSAEIAIWVLTMFGFILLASGVNGREG